MIIYYFKSPKDKHLTLRDQVQVKTGYGLMFGTHHKILQLTVPSSKGYISHNTYGAALPDGHGWGSNLL